MPNRLTLSSSGPGLFDNETLDIFTYPFYYRTIDYFGRNVYTGGHVLVVSSEQREAVVSAAGELFARFGLEKTTMEDIGAACHKAKSSLYYYFRSKEDIFAEVIRREIAGLQETILREMKREDDPYNRFRTFVMTKLTYLIETQNKYVTIREDYLRNYDFINSLTEEYCAWELNLIEGILSHGRDRGAFNVMDTKGTSRALYFAIKGIEYPWIVNFSKREIERGIDLLVDILLSGIHAI